jgi:hypothetical protein
MSRASVSKRPSSVEYTLDISDRNRVHVPTVPRDDPNMPRYVITPLGHVFRDDGRLQIPQFNETQLKVKFCDRRYARSLPKLVFLAFGHPMLIERWYDRADLHNYDPWVDPMGPIDPMTDRPCCTVNDVVLVPHKELIRHGRSNQRIRTRLSILSLP